MALRFVTISEPSVSTDPMPAASEKVMTRSRPERAQSYSILSEESSARVARFLRRRYPSKTAEMVSADTGIPTSTVKSWLRGIAKPGCDALLAMITAYEADFIAAVLPYRLGWLDKAARLERTAQLEAEQEQIERELAELRA